MLLVASQCLFRIPILTQSCIVQAKRLREAQRAGVSLVDARTGFGTRATQTRIPTGTTSATTMTWNPCLMWEDWTCKHKETSLRFLLWTILLMGMMFIKWTLLYCIWNYMIINYPCEFLVAFWEKEICTLPGINQGLGPARLAQAWVSLELNSCEGTNRN